MRYKKDITIECYKRGLWSTGEYTIYDYSYNGGESNGNLFCCGSAVRAFRGGGLPKNLKFRLSAKPHRGSRRVTIVNRHTDIGWAVRGKKMRFTVTYSEMQSALKQLGLLRKPHEYVHVSIQRVAK